MKVLARARVILVGAAVLAASAALPAPTLAARYFPETGYTVADPAFQDFFEHRGGVRTFGYPVSCEFTLLGYPVQIFQRAVMQRLSDGHVALLNLLDSGLFPYTEVNGAVFPGVDPRMVASAPRPGSLGYSRAVLDWLARVAPDRWQGKP